jgi:putative hemolysin
MTEILIIFVLTLISGLFSMAEIALISARKVRLRTDAEKGDRRAAHALALAEHPDTFLSTVQVGITVIGLFMGIYSGDRLTDNVRGWLEQFDAIRPYADSIAVGLLLLLITYLSLVLGELVPKRIGLTFPERIAKRVAAPMSFISRVTMPFIYVLTFSTTLLLRLFNIKKTKESFVTEEEIKAIVSEGLEAGTVDEIEQEIVENVFEISERSILSMMTHRPDIIWLDLNDTPAAYRDKIRAETHHAYPVCAETLDDVRGTVYLHDLYLAAGDPPLADLLKPALVIPESISAYQTLEKFRASRVKQGIIVDEFGSVKGLITVSDIFSAILGENPSSEHDEYYSWQEVDGDAVLVDGRMPFTTFLERIELKAEEEENDYMTVAGFVLHQLERIPGEGDAFDWHQHRFIVQEMDGNRVSKVLIRRPVTDSQESEPAAA